MLIFHIKRIISSEKWFNYVVTLFFFLIMPKIWVGRTTLNGEKRASPNVLKNTPSRHYRILEHGYIFKILQVNGQDNIPKLVLDINLYRS